MAVGVRGENDRNRRETMGRDKNEAGDRGMVLSTSKSTGEWFDSSGGRRHVSQSIIRMEWVARCKSVRSLRMVELIEWIGQVQRWSRAKQSVSKRRKGEEEREEGGGGDQRVCRSIKLTGVLSPPGGTMCG